MRDSRHAGTQQHAVMPISEARHDEQLPHAPQRLADEIAARGILPAPGADVHPVIHSLVAVRAEVLEPIIAPALVPATPRAMAHRVHHAAAAAPLAAPVVAEPLRRLEWLGARVPVRDVPAAPRTEREAVRHDPAAVVALRARHPGRVAPLQAAPAVGAIRPEALELCPAR